MNRTIKGLARDVVVEVRRPTLAELTKLRTAGATPAALAAFLRSVLVSHKLTELTALKPACVAPLATLVMEAYGLSADLDELDPEELDEEQAAAYAAAEKAGFSQPFTALRYAPKVGPAVFVLMRAPGPLDFREIEEQPKSLDAARSLTAKLCVQQPSPLALIDEHYPGLYHPISSVLYTRHAADEELTLGE
jgi:hypothetical protein